jgi:hypothetical protein
VPAEKLSPTVRAFLRRHIQSVEHVEILLLVSAEPDRTWTAQEVYDVILSSEASVARWLQRLADERLLVRTFENGEGFRPASDPTVAVQIEDLRHAYRTWPTRTIEAIYKREIDAVQGFADAFKLKENPVP